MISKSLGKLHKVRAQGEDTSGKAYASLEQMWQSQLDPVYIEAFATNASAADNVAAAAENETEEIKKMAIAGDKTSWYKGSVDYWDAQPATIDGVLGGYEAIHEVESDTSSTMIETFKHLMPSLGSSLDCGAGIGRIAKTTLLPKFTTVDLLEPSIVQIDEAKNYVPECRNFYHCGLQEHNYDTKYDCVWIQWVLCYLTDNDIADFLVKTKENGLTRGENGKTGLIFVKENVHASTFLLDKSDNSVMRTHDQFSAIFQDVGYTVLQDRIQRGMPDELHHIRCYVLKPNYQ